MRAMSTRQVVVLMSSENTFFAQCDNALTEDYIKVWCWFSDKKIDVHLIILKV